MATKRKTKKSKSVLGTLGTALDAAAGMVMGGGTSECWSCGEPGKLNAANRCKPCADEAAADGD